MTQTECEIKMRNSQLTFQGPRARPAIRDFLLVVISCIFVLNPFLLVGAQPGVGKENPLAAKLKANKKPNIIFILADDMGYGDLGCYGQEKIKTPNIDQLAKEGMRFTQCYAGSTVC